MSDTAPLKITQNKGNLSKNKWALFGQKFKLFWLKLPFYLGCVTGLACFGSWTLALTLLNNAAVVPLALLGILGLTGLGALILTIGFAIIHSQLSKKIKQAKNNIKQLEGPVNSPKNDLLPKKERDYQPENQTNLPLLPKEEPKPKPKQMQTEITLLQKELCNLCDQRNKRVKELRQDKQLNINNVIKTDSLIQNLDNQIKECYKKIVILNNQCDTLKKQKKKPTNLQPTVIENNTDQQKKTFGNDFI